MYGSFLPFFSDSYVTMKVQEVKTEGRKLIGKLSLRAAHFYPQSGRLCV